MFKFLKIRIKRIFTALKGMCLLLITETSIQVQFVFILFFVFAGFYFEISFNEWIIQIFLSENDPHNIGLELAKAYAVATGGNRAGVLTT